jgi:hypothetical protein
MRGHAYVVLILFIYLVFFIHICICAYIGSFLPPTHGRVGGGAGGGWGGGGPWAGPSQNCHGAGLPAGSGPDETKCGMRRDLSEGAGPEAGPEAVCAKPCLTQIWHGIVSLVGERSRVRWDCGNKLD